MNDIHKEAFREEAYELLSELEISLLELEDFPNNTELVNKVFRTMHTIKGSGAMFGFDNIAAFTHDIETVYDKVRYGSLSLTNDIIDLTLQAKDHIKSMLDEKDTLHSDISNNILSGFRRFVSDKVPDDNSGPEVFNEQKRYCSSLPPVGLATTYRIRFKPSPDIFTTGTNPLLLLDELKSLGHCEIIAYPDHIPPIEQIDPELCYTSWDIVITTDKGIDAVKDVFIFVEDSSEIIIDAIEDSVFIEGKTDYKKLGEILIERGDISQKDLYEVLSEKKYLGETLVEKGFITKDRVDAALAEQEHVRKIREKTKEEGAASSIRVPAEKIDVLVNLIGELVTVQAQLSQAASCSGGGELSFIAEEVERLTGELRDTTLNIRMLPIGTTFGRFNRLTRDLSRELNKEIDLTTDGAETELDKTVIEKLNDPLVHLIRNSIDHGIEMPHIRELLGKARTGTIRLSAVHSGSSVIIRIKDDGKGLDKEAILLKAIERGLTLPGIDLTDREIFSFIFHPGFSTAKEVTNVSGRGVGMDVVKKAIDALQGTIDIASEKGRGTTITIKLPLTLAIIEGLLVRIDDDRFVMPLSIVEECVELTREDVAKAHGRNLAYIRGELVPYISLRKEFNITGESPDTEQIVVTGINGNRVGFVVDNVIGQYQTVIKNLGRFYKNIEGISGATILGDGTVALIMDAQKIVKNTEAAITAHIN